MPGAAVGLIALLVLHEDLNYQQALWLGIDWAGGVRRSMGVAAFLLGMLMVSRLDYVHVVNRYVRREHPPMHLVWLVVLVAIGIFSPQVLLAVIATAYVLSGVVQWLGRSRSRKSPTQPHETRPNLKAKADARYASPPGSSARSK